MPNRSRASWADRRQAYFRPPWPESSWGRPARSLNAAYHRTRRPRCSSIGSCAQSANATSRKSHAEARPEVVKRAQDLAQFKGQRGLSLRTEGRRSAYFFCMPLEGISHGESDDWCCVGHSGGLRCDGTQGRWYPLSFDRRDLSQRNGTAAIVMLRYGSKAQIAALHQGAANGSNRP
jgi:hypothetical protein